MRTIRTCANPAEAGFLQSLLHEQGIEAFAPDPGMVPSGAYQVALQVAPEDYDRANTVLEDFAASQRATSDEIAEKPASSDKFPFFGIAGVVTVLWVIVIMARSFFVTFAERDLDSRIVDTLAVTVGSIFMGMLVGCVVSGLCLISRPLWRRLTKD